MKQPDKFGLGTYIFGFGASLILTLSAYELAVHHSLSRRLLIGSLAGLAFTQFVVQLVCFLHLGKERQPRWKFWVFWGMIGVVLILVAGSLWIMYNLNYHQSLQYQYKYLNSQGDGL